MKTWNEAIETVAEKAEEKARLLRYSTKYRAQENEIIKAEILEEFASEARSLKEAE